MSADEEESSCTIGFASFAPISTEIYLADGDGSNAKPLLSNSDQDQNVSISHDGQWIAFSSERPRFRDEAALLILIGAVFLLTITNARIRRASAAKNKALATAHEAVDQMLTRVAEEELLNVPMAEPIRESLLKDALHFYEGFAAQAESDPSVSFELARVLRSVSHIQFDLGREEDARNSQVRSLRMLRTLMEHNPEEPTYREQLASGYTFVASHLMESPTDSSDKEAETYVNKALDLYANLERDFPERPQYVATCWRLLADIMSYRGNLLEASRLYRQCIARQEPNVQQFPSANAWTGLSWDCHAFGSKLSTGFSDREEEAEDILLKSILAAEAALKIEPQSKSARLAHAWSQERLGVMYLRLGRVNEATDLFRRSLKESELLLARSPWTTSNGILFRALLDDLTKAFKLSGHSEESNQTFLQVYDFILRTTAQAPENFPSTLEIVRCQLSLVSVLRSKKLQRETDELLKLTIKTKERCIELAKQDARNGGHDSSRDVASILAVSGDVLREKGDTTEAEVAYQEALNADPECAVAHRGMTKLLLSQGRLEQAKEHADRVVNLDNHSSGSYSLRGEVNSALKDHKSALADYEKSLALDSQQGWVVKRRGAAHVFLGEFDEALVDFQRAVELGDLSTLGWLPEVALRESPVSFRQGMVRIADQLVVQKGTAEMYHNRGHLHLQFDNPELALADFDKAIELDPSDPHHWDIRYPCRGDAYAKLGRWEESLMDYSRGIQLFSTEPEVWNVRAQAYCKLQKWAEAQADLERVIKLASDSPVVHY